MRIDALLLTSDFSLQRALERSLQEFGIAAERHANGQQALQRVAEWKFGAIISDCDHFQGVPLLQSARQQRRNRNTIAIAVVRSGSSIGTAFRAGANFVLEKPVTRDRVSRLMRAAFSLIACEHFRYLRHALDIPVTLLLSSGVSLQGKSRNLSSRGLGVQSELLSSWPSNIRVRFRPSAVCVTIEADCELAWSDAYGRAGLKLAGMPRASHRELGNWIAARTEPLVPRLDFLRPPQCVPELPYAACS